jgi:hypothetical protein
MKPGRPKLGKIASSAMSLRAVEVAVTKTRVAVAAAVIFAEIGKMNI